MYPAGFEYERPASVDEALTLLAANPDARLLAGGHGLLPDLKTGRAEAGLLVDVGHLDDLAGVEAPDGPNGAVRVGALTTHATAAASDALWTHAPVVAEAARKLGDRQVRNRGTVGGNLAEADPAADLPAAVLAADATLRVRGRDGERVVPVDEFFEGDGATALGDAELLTAVERPSQDDADAGAGAGGAYVRKTHPATGYAMVGVGAVVHVADGTVTDARVAATGATDRAVRLRGVEDALRDANADRGAVEAAAESAGDDLDDAVLRGDHHASAPYRRRLLGPYAERALTAALDRVGDDATPAVSDDV